MTENPDLAVVPDEFQETFEIDSEVEEFARRLGVEVENYHALLESWQAVLAPAEKEAQAKPGMAWATKMVGTYAGLAFADVPEVQRRFFDKVLTLRALVDDILEEDPDALRVESKEEDADRNRHHYLNLLQLWQCQVVAWEQEWDCTDPHAAAELASISEVHNMFLGAQGLIAHLESINFEFTEADQAMLIEALESVKEVS